MAENNMGDADRAKKIREICKCLQLSDDTIKRVVSEFVSCMEKGLSDTPGVTSTLKMLPSYVRAVPNGSERGDYLALDLGGTNFRVLLIRLTGTSADMSGKIYRLPDNVIKGPGTGLFDHIALCLENFMEENGLRATEKIPLGFTFSFPCTQESLAVAKLIAWTKGFNASGVVGQDVGEFLREACLRRKNLDIDVVAVLNDTVGTLMACAFKEPTCQIGVIVGTGSNACYMEKIDNCPKFKKFKFDEDKLPKEMIINLEWGAFGDDGALDFIRTRYDVAVDERTLNPGRQLFEKMISGMYLGEIVRYVLCHLAEERLIFNGDYDKISQPNTFPTKYVSEIDNEIDEEQRCHKTKMILEDIGLQAVTIADCIHVGFVCSIVGKRAAHLCAIGISSLIKRIGKPYVTVGVDGSVYRFHKTFGRELDKKIDSLLPPNLEYQLMLSEDGSGRGAALVAAVAARVNRLISGKN